MVDDTTSEITRREFMTGQWFDDETDGDEPEDSEQPASGKDLPREFPSEQPITPTRGVLNRIETVFGSLFS